jgi:hypothetical protein
MPDPRWIAEMDEAADAEIAAEQKIEEEIARLRQIITEYARHNEGCNAQFGAKYRCRCGWRQYEAEFVPSAEPTR